MSHRAAFGLLGAALTWLAFFWIAGVATTHPAPHNVAVAVGDGVYQCILFLWHALATAYDDLTRHHATAG